MNALFGRIWIERRGYKPALIFRGRRRLSAIIQTPKIVVVSLPLDWPVTELEGSLRAIAIKFRVAARQHGQTKQARRLLATLR